MPGLPGPGPVPLNAQAQVPGWVRHEAEYQNHLPNPNGVEASKCGEAATCPGDRKLPGLREMPGSQRKRRRKAELEAYGNVPHCQRGTKCQDAVRKIMTGAMAAAMAGETCRMSKTMQNESRRVYGRKKKRKNNANARN